MDGTPYTASPQAENGHIDIANELAEAFYKLQLSGYQWRLLWVIFRQTYGWKKKQDRISTTFFEERTGIERRNVAHALADLSERKIIVKNNNGFIVSYGIQKDYSKWIYKPLLKSTTSRHKTESSQEDTSKPLLISTPLKSTTKPLLKSTHTKETKETIVGAIFSKISELEKRYSDQETINQTFQAISSTRKSSRIADSVRLSILQSWGKYPISQVMEGIRKYLDRQYYQQGKDEKYLLGIIRNGNTPQEYKGAPPGPIFESSGSPLLDKVRRGEIRPIIEGHRT